MVRTAWVFALRMHQQQFTYKQLQWVATFVSPVNRHQLFYSLLRTKNTHFACTLAMPHLPLSIHFQPDSYVFTEDFHFSYSIPSAGSMWGMGDMYS